MNRLLLIEKGLCGTHGQGLTDGGSYSTSNGVHEEYVAKLEEGGHFIDKSFLDEGHLATRVINGPMCDLRLPHEAVDKLDVAAAARMVPGLGGEFKTMAKAATAGWSGLDMVGIGVYLQYWRESGAKTYQKVGGELVEVK